MSSSKLFDIYLLTGSNLGDKLNFLNSASDILDSYFQQKATKSRIYQSDAWGFETDSFFLNQVLKYNTNFSPIEVLDKIQCIENQLGRVRNENSYESRTIDIDILLYGNEIIDTNTLMIPHPRLHLRKFTLLPLNELTSNLIHPVLHQSIRQILQECKDVGNCFALNK